MTGRLAGSNTYGQLDGGGGIYTLCNNSALSGLQQGGGGAGARLGRQLTMPVVQLGSLGKLHQVCFGWRAGEAGRARGRHWEGL